MYECKAVMPEKIVSLYNLGNMYSSSSKLSMVSNLVSIAIML